MFLAATYPYLSIRQELLPRWSPDARMVRAGTPRWPKRQPRAMPLVLRYNLQPVVMLCMRSGGRTTYWAFWLWFNEVLLFHVNLESAQHVQVDDTNACSLTA